MQPSFSSRIHGHKRHTVMCCHGTPLPAPGHLEGSECCILRRTVHPDSPRAARNTVQCSRLHQPSANAWLLQMTVICMAAASLSCLKQLLFFFFLSKILLVLNSVCVCVCAHACAVQKSCEGVGRSHSVSDQVITVMWTVRVKPF